MKAAELLKIDFNKHERVAMNNVIMTGMNIKTIKGNSGDISLLGFIGKSLMFTAHYQKDDVIKIKELEENYLVIRREEGRDETN